MIQLPEWSGGSLPVKTEPPQIVLLLLSLSLSLLRVLLFGTPLNACVCTLRITRTCKQKANYQHAEVLG